MKSGSLRGYLEACVSLIQDGKSSPTPLHHIMFKPHKAISLLAIAGLVLASTAVNAATTYTAGSSSTAGDLILGFRQTDGSNANTLLVDLGSAANFRGTTVTTGALSAGNIGAALSSWYVSNSGSTWSSDPNVLWGIVGTQGSASESASGVNGVRDTSNTLYGTQYEGVYGTQATALNDLGNASQGGPRGQVETMAGAFLGQTQVGSLDATIQSNSATSSWNSFQSGSTLGSKGFGFFSNLEGNFANGVAGNNAALDLFRFSGTATSGTPSQYLGTFTISNAGQVSFGTSTPIAVPEPSRVAFLGLGLAGVLFRRRRK